MAGRQRWELCCGDRITDFEKTGLEVTAKLTVLEPEHSFGNWGQLVNPGNGQRRQLQLPSHSQGGELQKVQWPGR